MKKTDYCNGFFLKAGKFILITEKKFMFFGIFFGLFLFFIPSIHGGMQQFLKGIPLLYSAFESATKLENTFVYPMLIVTIYNAVVLQVAIKRGFPGGWDTNIENGLPTAKEVNDRMLFPSSKNEAIVFSLWVILKIMAIFIWTWPFLLLGYFLRIGK
ncbi:hypothetical protein [Azonexus sp.]|uniref:hypothetical protein n=1 Tax=Azonexus sp. TaxID=1872668 RepID=UPI0027BA9E98|nr:hypothetical protein [Azonexus sp.]